MDWILHKGTKFYFYGIRGRRFEPATAHETSEQIFSIFDLVNHVLFMHPINLDKYLKGDVYHYSYNTRRPYSPLIGFNLNTLGYLLIGLTLLEFVFAPLWSIISGIVAMGIFLYDDGIEVDFGLKKYRYFTSFGSLVLGEWLDISDMHYISVFKTGLTLTFNDPYMGANYGSDTISAKDVLQVNLIVGHNERLRLLETGDLQSDVFGFAKQLASKLNLRIWDATERKGKWYEEPTSLEEPNFNTPIPASTTFPLQPHSRLNNPHLPPL